MAKVKILPIASPKASSVKDLSISTNNIVTINSLSKILNADIRSEVIDITTNSKIVNISRKEKIIDTIPFRVRFMNIGLPSGYGPGNGAPIGIAVIGVSNYVM